MKDGNDLPPADIYDEDRSQKATGRAAVENDLPSNPDAERTILGAVLLDNRVFEEVSEKLEPADFSLTSHQQIFRRMADMMNRDIAIDMITLANELNRQKQLEEVGGVAYLASLTEGLPFNPAIENYILIVRDKSLLRKLMAVSTSAIARAEEQVDPAIEIVEELEQWVVEIAERGLVRPLETFGTYVEHRYPQIDSIFETSARQQGLSTGFKELDEITCGLQRKDLIIVAARPSMGKTALGLGIAMHAAILLGRTVAFFSLEMSKEAMLQRAMAIEGGIALQDIREGRWTHINRRYAVEALDRIVGAPLYLDDEAGMTVRRMKSKALRLKNQTRQLDLVVIDQLNHIEFPEWVRRMNRTDQVGAVTRALKAMAKALDTPVMVLHQLSRENMKREDKEPQLSDLRDSGNVEQDADVVIFPHRPGYYSKDQDEKAKRGAVLIVAKQRQGPMGRANCEFIPDQARYRDVHESTLFNTWPGGGEQ